MSTTAQIVTMISILASLYLVTRGFRSHGHSLGNTAKMALVWGVIIVLGTLLISYFAA